MCYTNFHLVLFSGDDDFSLILGFLCYILHSVTEVK